MKEPVEAVSPAASLDQLIARLPPIGFEASWNGDKWELKADPATMKSLVEGGVALTGDQWKRILVGIGALRIRDRWPADRPFAITDVRAEVLPKTNTGS